MHMISAVLKKNIIKRLAVSAVLDLSIHSITADTAMSNLLRNSLHMYCIPPTAFSSGLICESVMSEIIKAFVLCFMNLSATSQLYICSAKEQTHLFVVRSSASDLTWHTPILNYWLHATSSPHLYLYQALLESFVKGCYAWCKTTLKSLSFFPFCRVSAPRGAITYSCWRQFVSPGSPWSSCCDLFRPRASVCSCVRL